MTERDSKGMFQAGHGVKGGRPRGQTASEILRAMLEPHKDEVIAKLVELAKAGDPAAMKLYMERVAPPPRPELERVCIPALKESGSLVEKAQAIVDAVADGSVAVESGRELLGMLNILGKALVVDDLERRLEKIEQGKLPLKDIDGEVIDVEDLV